MNNRWRIHCESVLLILILGVTGLATTWREVTVTCPLCQTRTTDSVPGSTFIPGTTADFRPQGVGVDWGTESLISCSKCGFTTSAGRFDATNGLDVPKVRAAVEAFKSPRIFQTLDRAILVEQNWTNNPGTIAHLRVAAKWLADDTGEPATIRLRLAAAIESQKVLLENPTLSNEARAHTLYMLGEFSRQSGDLPQAVEWLTRARDASEGHLRSLVEQQLFLAQHGQTSAVDMLEVLGNLPDAAKVAAISALRQSEDARVTAFLRDFCLNGPDEFREASIRGLVGESPHRRHLPIFLEGLLNRHFRTVQSSAYAVQLLKAREAAPIIVQALKDPVENADYRLLAALAVLATEQQLDFLIEHVNRDHYSTTIFAAFLATRSPRAVPYIVQMLRKDPMHISYNPEADLENAAAIGAPLLNQLPDLKARESAKDGLAVFKIRVLRTMHTPEALQQLTDALQLGDGPALYAALALAARGNRAGKSVLLDNLIHIRRMDHESINLVYPLLDSTDYDDLLVRMEADRVSRKKSLDDSTALYNQLLSMATDDREREAYQMQRDRVKWDEDGFMADWVPLLGATGNSKGREMYLQCLGSPETRVKTAAALALGRVYNAQVRDVFIARLQSEETWVLDAVVTALQQSADPAMVEQLLSVVQEPTLVSTKLAWMDTMMALDRQRAIPHIREWAGSPHPELARRCRVILAN